MTPYLCIRNQLRTRLPWFRQPVLLMWSAKWRRRWPNATTRSLCVATAMHRCETWRVNLAHGGREGRSACPELVERVAQTVAQARPGKQAPHTAGRAVNTIGERIVHLIRRVFLIGDALKSPEEAVKRRSAFGRTVHQMPDRPDH